MSKRDGRMYLAARLVAESETSMGLPIRVADDTCAGCMFVFWTKTAAREVYGRGVELIELNVRSYYFQAALEAALQVDHKAV